MLFLGGCWSRRKEL
ncbi:hypothetical protein [Acinetobacter pittii]